jgi:hypothetical protein
MSRCGCFSAFSPILIFYCSTHCFSKDVFIYMEDKEIKEQRKLLDLLQRSCPADARLYRPRGKVFFLTSRQDLITITDQRLQSLQSRPSPQ